MLYGIEELGEHAQALPLLHMPFESSGDHSIFRVLVVMAMPCSSTLPYKGIGRRVRADRRPESTSRPSHPLTCMRLREPPNMLEIDESKKRRMRLSVTEEIEF